MPGLSKSRIIQHRQCPKRLWLSVYRSELADVDDAATARLNAGHEVGDVARGLHPKGILIESPDAKEALLDTQKVLSGKHRPVFEAAFAFDGVLVRTDLLLPVRGGYRMVEVKSSTSVKDYHLADAAVQSWVATKAGLSVKRIEVAHIDSSFIYPGNGEYEGLFVYADVSGDTQPLIKEVPKWVKKAKATLAGKEPAIKPGGQCKDPFECPFISYCYPELEATAFPPEILPHKSGKDLAIKLRAEGYEDLRKVPGKWFTTPKLQRVWRVTRKGKTELDPEAGEALKALSYPRYHLDFETMHFAVPIWAGTRPYRQIPFQWSCHIEGKNGTVEHKHFLVKDANDPRRDFAASLIDTLKAKGPILVYNAGFESGRLQELVDDFPDMAPAINAIRDRIFDLLTVARNHYYHRDMRGSWSLKVVLPTIAPELAYDDLEVADGGMAQKAYAEILHPDTPPVRVNKLRNDLLAYCERDTWALIRIAQFFEDR